MKTRIEIPAWMMEVRYNGKIIPNGKEYELLETGANCQVFAYYLLRYYGKFVPELRSSELWTDQEYSEIITNNYQALDIAFFNKSAEPWGAHVGVFLNEQEILHLAKKEGKPVIWNIQQFLTLPLYQVMLGAKRFKNNN